MPTGQQPQNGGQNETRTLIRFMIIALICTSLFNVFLSSFANRSVEEIPYSQFKTMVAEGQVSEVVIEEDRLLISAKPEDGTEVSFYKQPEVYYTGLVDDPELYAEMDEAGVVWQMVELGKVDQGGGGTVAVYMAERDIDTLDAGVPVLSMHAPFETVAKLDCYMTYKGMKAVFEAK